jgi:branched-chain amino acid aminotransferase
MKKSINPVESYCVINEEVLSTTSFQYDIKDNSKILYEVIRVKESAPIFFYHHLVRLEKSINLLGLKVPNMEQIKGMVAELLKANPIKENNIRISLVYPTSTSAPDLLVYFIASHYPSANQKEFGVTVKTLCALRNNPNAKVENLALRNEADRIIAESGCYEVLLVNNEGFITEGSRSNVFFIKGNSLITPPISMVLGGITRQMVISIAKSINIPIIESTISFKEVDRLDGAFITGTSPGLLPISKIDSIGFDVKSNQYQTLINAYEVAIKEDILKFKTNKR